MLLINLSLILITFIANLHWKKNYSIAYKTDLYEKLFKNYNKYLRPRTGFNEPLKVIMDPMLHNIVKSNKAKGQLIFLQWQKMFWIDENLIWNPDDYDGIDILKIAKSHVWIPDISIINMIKVDYLMDLEKLNVVVHSNGSVIIYAPQMVTLHCEYDVSNFPFDVQTCSVFYASWMYDHTEIDIHPTSPTNVDYYVTNFEWILLNYTFSKSSKVYGTSNESVVEVFYYIKIKRRPEYYLMIFFLPTFIITTLSIIGVYSPFNETGERTQKVSMGLTTLLSMVFILLLVSNQMPKTSADVIRNYIIIETALSAIATLMSVSVLHLHRRNLDGKSAPVWLLLVTSTRRREIISEDGINIREKFSNAQQNFLTCNSDAENANEIEYYRPKTLKEMTSNMKKIIDTIIRLEKLVIFDGENEYVWIKICRKIDICLMITFLIINTLVTVGFIVYGFNSSK